MRFKADYSEQTGRAYIEDSVFENDARLYINGDFADFNDEMRYARRIAILLNKAIEQDPELKWK